MAQARGRPTPRYRVLGTDRAIWSLRAHQYVVALFEPGEDAIQDPDAGGVAGQSLVQADDDQAPPLGALVVELVELVDELLLVGGGVEGGEIKAGDVVEVHRVGHRRERTAVDRLQERLVG